MKKVWAGILVMILALAVFAGMAAAEETIAVGQTKNANVQNSNLVLYKFVPQETGLYRFSSIVDEECAFWTVGCLLDEEMISVGQSSYSSYDNPAFTIQEKLEAGETYYFGATIDMSEIRTGSFQVKLERVTGLCTWTRNSDVYVDYNKEGTAEIGAYSDCGGLTYQWYDGSIAIQGATGEKYTFPAATGEKTYRCHVKDQENHTADVDITVHINSKLNYTLNGDYFREVEYGGSTDLAVTATAAYGADQITYQWYVEGDSLTLGDPYPIENETSPVLHLTNVTSSKSYYCEVTDINGVVYEPWFSVTVPGETTASALGSSTIEINSGEDATMTVQAEGTEYAPLIYRWYEGNYMYGEGTLLSEGSSPTYTAENVRRTKDFFCIVINSRGNSEYVSFTVKVAGTFSVEAANDETYLSKNAGETKTIGVTATSTYGALSYQWYSYNNTIYRKIAIEGATAATYTLAGDAKGGSYYCEVTDTAGNMKTLSFQVTVNNLLSVEPDSTATRLQMNPGDTAVLKVKASANAGNIQYRWNKILYDTSRHYYSVSERIVGAKSNTLAITCEGRCRYECYVYDQYGNTGSVSFEIVLDNQFSVTYEGNISVRSEQPFELKANVSYRNGPISYKWSHSVEWQFIPMPEVTGDTLSVAHATADTTGRYRLEVWDEYGNYADIYFTVLIDNNLTAEAVGDTEQTVLPGDSATLAVTATCDKGSITYTWYEQVFEENGYWNWEKMTNETGSSIQLTNIQRAREYRCEVRDEYGGYEEVHFSILIDNGLTVLPVGSRYKYVEAGSDVELKVTASCNNGGKTYQWYEYAVHDDYGYQEWGYDTIANANTDTYTLQHVSKRGQYRCEVKDEFGGEKYTDFFVSIENGLTAESADKNYDYVVATGEEKTLSLIADCKHGGLHYQWHRRSNPDDYYAEAEEIAGATESSYTADEVTEKRVEYTCVITDDYENSISIIFNLYADTELTAEPAGDTVYRVSDAPITLAVNAQHRFPEDEIQYEWFYEYNPIGGADGDTYTIENPMPGVYRCFVSDRWNRREVWFYITDEAFAQAYGDGRYQVSPDEEVTLQAVAWNAEDDIVYEWYDNDRVLIEGETGSTYTITAEHNSNYYCRVTGTGLEEELQFQVCINNDFQINPEGMHRVNVIPAGGSVQLTMNIQSTNDDQLSYSWFKDDDATALGETTNKLTVTEAGRYSAYATDRFGNTFNDSFYCLSAEPEILAEGQEGSGADNEDVTIYRLIPAKAGIYQIEGDGWTIFRQGDWYNIGWISMNDDGYVYRLKAGETYYVTVYSYSTGFRYTLLDEDGLGATEYTVTLPKGMTLWIPDLYTDGQWESLDYAASSNQYVISVDDSRMETLSEGTATVTAVYQRGTQKVYHITVGDGNTLILPAQLETIETEAFSGDTSILFVELGMNVRTVKRGAFANTGNICVTMKGYDTEIEGGAFSGSNPIVICNGGNTEWNCRDLGIPFFILD